MNMKDSILKNKKAAILTLGCKVNQYESDAMGGLLKQAGCRMVDFQEKADIYIVNTCSVTNIADRKSRQMLHRARKNNPQAAIVAAGCYVQADPAHAMEDAAVDLALGNNLKHNIVEILEEYFISRRHLPVQNCMDLSKPVDYEPLCIGNAGSVSNTRAYVKVQDGCNQFCSYCIIPYTRGRIRSRLPEDVLAEVRELAQGGCREIVLTGIHLASYGMDKKDNIGGKEGLLALASAVSEVEGICRVRLGSLEPGIITEEFLEGLKNNSKFCPHFHLSLQSACDETLKRMNRKYTIEEYVEKCSLVRRYFDNPAITTDVIVGFPGETEEEFRITVENLEKLNLYEMHVFKFSPRKNTVAYGLPGQVPEPVKSKRSEALMEMARRHQACYEEQFEGQSLFVLVEEMIELAGRRYASGHTANYIKVLFPSEEDLGNQLVQVCYGRPYSKRI